MGGRTITLLTKAQKALEQLGEHIKLARLRRKLSAEQVDLLKVAADDELGRRLQDADIIVKKRSPKKK